MSTQKRPFLVPFVGLKIGKHNFDFELSKTFFEAQGYDGFFEANVSAKVELNKKETMLIVNFHLEGPVAVACDRCTESVEHDLTGDYQLIYKFGTEESKDENLIVLHPDAYEVDLAEALYELAVVSLPNKITHMEGACNEEMVSVMEQYVVNLNSDDEDEDWEEEDAEDEDKRSPWDILKDLN